MVRPAHGQVRSPQLDEDEAPQGAGEEEGAPRAPARGEQEGRDDDQEGRAEEGEDGSAEVEPRRGRLRPLPRAITAPPGRRRCGPWENVRSCARAARPGPR